ncbi:MAG: glycosyltransferase family 4 protein [Cytophagaceae bacterium]|nr:glycosyltransferase family 4 protein [Cytophagaceae bacterium]
MNIVYFYSEVMGYTLAVIKSLVKDHGAKVHVVFWDKGLHTPFELPALEGVHYYKRSEMSRARLEQLLIDLSPPLLYISGRMDSDYLKASVKVRRKGTIVVSGFDNQWKPSLKNYAVMILSRWLYKKYFDFIWIPGTYQYEFAKRLGYSNQQIIWNLLSADTDLFRFEDLPKEVNKQFVFTGRFAPVKGIELLIEAFLKSKKVQPHNWKLVLIGNGPLAETFDAHEDIQIMNFMQPEQLAEKMHEGGVFVLPSLNEPWGVVLHEYASAGFPIICSEACGAALTFVQNDYNGFIVLTGNLEALTESLLKMVRLSSDELKQMGTRSHELSKKITPLISSSSLLSVLKNKRT